MPTKALVTSYRQDLMLFPDRWHKVAIVLGGLFLGLYPLLFTDYWVTVANHAMIAVVGSVGLMVLTGFCGQISMGHAAFLALGAYTTAVLGTHFQIPFWLGIPAGGLVAAAVGLMVGPFALKLRGLYLAIVTVGLVFLVEHLLLHLPELTGGPMGIEVTSLFGFGPASGSLDDFTPRKPLDLGVARLHSGQIMYYLFLVIAATAAFIAKNVHRSNTGRAMMAVRDQDIAASVLGVHPSRTKIIAFGLSSFLAGVAGGMLAMEQTYLNVENFNLHLSIEYIAMIVMGGIGTVYGAVAGAVGYVIIEPLAHLVGGFLPFMEEWSDKQQSTFIFAWVICGFLIFEPLGLFGIWLRIKRYFMAWPFRY